MNTPFPSLPPHSEEISAIAMSSLLPPSLLLLSALLAHASQQAIDNAVAGIPSVACSSDTIGISVRTEKPFLGRIFVKGMSKRRECVREFLNSTYLHADLDIRLSSCGMRRERKLSPAPGLEESVTIVVSFHYVFITQVDRAYKIICSYSQDSLAVVTHGLNISSIPTIPLTPPPASSRLDCQYEIRREGFNGPMAMYAEVGDRLFHRWICNGESDMKILVKSCLVSDGTGEMFVVIDDRGCAVDPIVLGDLTYNGNTAWVASRAFKFADTSFLGFSCTIQSCRGGENCQDISPPVCSVEGDFPEGILRKNFKNRKADSPIVLPIRRDEVDVSAPNLNILDSKLYLNPQQDHFQPPLDNRIKDLYAILRQRGNSKERQPRVEFPDFVYPIKGSDSILPRSKADRGKDICMSKLVFGVLLVITLGLMFVMGVVSVVLYTNLSKARKLWWSGTSSTSTTTEQYQ